MSAAQLFLFEEPKQSLTFVLVDYDGTPIAAETIDDAGDRWDIPCKWLFLAWKEHQQKISGPSGAGPLSSPLTTPEGEPHG